MNSRDFLTVLLRVLTLIIGVSLLGMAALYMPVMLAAENSERPYMIALAGIVLLALILFWAFASKLATLLLPKSSQDNIVAATSLVHELTRAALCVIAVYYIVSSLSGLPVVLIIVSSGSEAFKVTGGESLLSMFIISPIIDLVIGISLLLMAGRIASRISNGSASREKPSSAL